MDPIFDILLVKNRVWLCRQLLTVKRRLEHHRYKIIRYRPFKLHPMTGNSNKNRNKKVLFGVAPAMPILGILIAKGELGPIVLFIVGITLGIIIGIGLKTE